VGYCQGNFNSDNCAAGGFTLDYGPFGFCELFDPRFQPWTGGGPHFCFFNQPAAAEANYRMFWKSLRTLMEGQAEVQAQLDQLLEEFPAAMQEVMQRMWSSKLGLPSADDALVQELLKLLVESSADYAMFFRRLSDLPEQIDPLRDCFYLPLSAHLESQWNDWLLCWRAQWPSGVDPALISAGMRRVNPAITWREWLIAPAYQQAAEGDTSLMAELQQLFSTPYDTPSADMAARYDRLKPREFFSAGGVSHYSCSS
jgi:uncharacterized protein YdiU (UPF0061 family)